MVKSWLLDIMMAVSGAEANAFIPVAFHACLFPSLWTMYVPQKILPPRPRLEIVWCLTPTTIFETNTETKSLGIRKLISRCSKPKMAVGP